MSFRLPRLEALLGTTVSEVGVAQIARLVEGQVPEDADLEFKQQLYGDGVSDRRGLATDVAAMANSAGGAIIIGIRDEGGRAAELTPVTFSGQEEVRIHQIVATYSAPPPMFDIVHVADDVANGFALIVVPPSSLRPHAVRVDEKLKYPVRDGPHIRYLFEHEIAAAYRDRFERGAARDARLDTVLAEGLARLDRERTVWLCFALVPEMAGAMEITRRAVREARGFALTFTRPYLGYEAWGATEVETGVGVRKLTLSGGTEGDSGRAIYTYADLHTDGSGFVAKPVWMRWPKDQEGDPKVNDQTLIETMASLVRFLVDQSVRSRAAGHALAAATIVGALPATLVHGRYAGRVERVGGSRPLAEEVVSRRTISLDAIRTEPRELVHVVRTLVADLLQGFGVPEPIHITAAGELRRPAFVWRGREVAWGTWAGGFPTVETPLIDD